MLIRKIRLSDSRHFLELCNTLDKETRFMMLEPGERKTTIEEVEQRIKKLQADDHSLILVCEKDGILIGHLTAIRDYYRRTQHCIYIVVGIQQEFKGQGIGTNLFIELENWALLMNIHRLELTVMTHNDAGVNLYKKMGFEIEGLKKHSLLVDGHYIDEYYMAELL
jgi:RimJ/RimL family protein N-acetyltransferase